MLQSVAIGFQHQTIIVASLHEGSVAVYWIDVPGCCKARPGLIFIRTIILVYNLFIYMVFKIMIKVSPVCSAFHC